MSVLALLNGLAADMNAHSLGVWRPATPYLPGERGIILNDLPESPDELIVLTPYLETEIGTYRRDSESVVHFIQVRLRVRAAADAHDLQERIKARYHRRRVALTYDGETFAATGRQLSRGPLGPDSNRRYLFTQNFSFTVLQVRT